MLHFSNFGFTSIQDVRSRVLSLKTELTKSASAPNKYVMTSSYNSSPHTLLLPAPAPPVDIKF